MLISVNICNGNCRKIKSSWILFVIVLIVLGPYLNALREYFMEQRKPDIVLSPYRAGFDNSMKRNGLGFFSVDNSRLMSNQTNELDRTLNVSTRGYCNHILNFASIEGTNPSGYKLVSVQVVIRHGDRSPMYSIPHVTKPIWICPDIPRELSPNAFNYFLESVESHLKSKQKIKTKVKVRKCSDSELTYKGIIQHLQTGLLLKRAYKQKLNLSSANVYVRSTHYTRTYGSARALLVGLLSHVNISMPAVEIHTGKMFEALSTTMCSPMLAHVPCKCPAIQEIIKTEAEYEKSFKRNDTVYLNIKQEIAEVIGATTSSLSLFQMIDVLAAYVCHDKALPCSSKTKQCISTELVDKLWHYMDNFTHLQSNFPAHKMRCFLEAYPLLSEIAFRLSNSIRNSSTEQFVLYSGHDKTIHPLLVTLGINFNLKPAYASRLVLELYQRDSDQHFALRILSNGKDVTYQLTFCTFFRDQDGRVLCPANEFIEYIFSQRNEYNTICLNI